MKAIYSFQKVANTSTLGFMCLAFPKFHSERKFLDGPFIFSTCSSLQPCTKSLTYPSISGSRFHLASKTRQSKPHRCSKPCSFKVSRNFVSVVFNKGGSQLPVQKSNWLPGTCHKKKRIVGLGDRNGMK